MTDAQLIEGFESRTLPPEHFGHREHVRLAWLYLRRGGRDDTERKLLDGLRSFAARAGKPDKFDAALTVAWIAVLDDAVASVGSGATFDALVAARPDLLDPASVRARR
jgi:hypothetical protein